MEPLLSNLIVRAAPRIRHLPSLHHGFHHNTRLSLRERPKHYDTASAPDSSHSQPAADVSQNVTAAEKDHYYSRVEHASQQMQTRSPWTRAGSDIPPVARNRSASAMTKGKLLTTPSRMLKLILPLTTRDANHDRKDVEPLALLVHPQQPLSYLERLIQSELPMMWDEGKGRERAPEIAFRAQDNSDEEEREQEEKDSDGMKGADGEEGGEGELEETRIDGKVERTGKISGGKKEEKRLEEEKRKEAEKKFNKDDPEHPNFVRWSPSTEIGDFIRDAARGKEFAVDIEKAPDPIYVAVPSFQDRTYYLRMRLRKAARQISTLADIKQECDTLAHRGAKRVAQAGFAGLVGWWGLVYYLTFRTELGWDVMEPVTYLVGLSGLMGGYMWFLYHNREVSYRSAMHFTVSRRQNQLYELKGFNLPHWETLIEEGNRLRREIKLIAEEYDVDWDETKDEGDEKVREALRKERQKKQDKEDDQEDKKDHKGKDD